MTHLTVFIKKKKKRVTLLSTLKNGERFHDCESLASLLKSGARATMPLCSHITVCSGSCTVPVARGQPRACDSPHRPSPSHILAPRSMAGFVLSPTSFCISPPHSSQEMITYSLMSYVFPLWREMANPARYSSQYNANDTRVPQFL